MLSEELHGYHCDCEYCEVRPDHDAPALHAQRDSSCNGEFISRILTHGETGHDGLGPLDIMAALETAAVEVDAEPGMGSGCHVHVGNRHLTRRDEFDGRVVNDAGREAFWAYLRWERVLIKLAAGRFQTQRAANYEVLTSVTDYLRNHYQTGSGIGPATVAHLEAGDELDVVKAIAYDSHYRSDRHSNLNLRTGKPTWEFRLWNSTRAAWRMELWTRLSVALVDPAVVQTLNEAELVHRVTPAAFERLASYLDNCGHSRAAELVERQSTYARDIAPTAPSSLTVLV